MNFTNFFRNIFGIPDRPSTQFPDTHFERQNELVPNRDDFRKPIWNLDDDDDDDDDFRLPPTSSFGFQIFTNPLEIHRFFEHQMGEIIRNFQNEILDSIPSSHFGEQHGLEPPEGVIEQDAYQGDKYLKPGYRARALLKEADVDLDERIRTGGLDSILQDPKQEPDNVLIPSGGLQWGGFGRRDFTHTIRRSDGTMEHHRTVWDSHGNKETTVKRQVGDQSYTVTTQLDSNGVETRTENFVNIDEGRLSDFTKKWKYPAEAGQLTPQEDSIEPKPHNWFPFDKFFQ